MTGSGTRTIEAIAAGRERWWVETNPAIIADLERTVASLPQPEDACKHCGGAQYVLVGPTRLPTTGVQLAEAMPPAIRSVEACPECNAPKPADLLAAADIPALYADCRLETFPTTGDKGAALAQVRAWLEAGPAQSLVLSGATGRGKTGLAVAAVRDLCERGIPARFVQVANLMQRARAAIATDSVDVVFDRYRTVRVVVLDDIAAVRPGWVQEQLPTLFEERRTAGLVTVITTDKSAAEIAALYDERLVSRFRECVRISVGGEDLRGRA